MDKIAKSNHKGLDQGTVTESWRQQIGFFALFICEAARFYPISELFLTTLCIPEPHSIKMKDTPWVDDFALS